MMVEEHIDPHAGLEENNGISLGYGRAWLTAKGRAVIAFLCTAVVIALTIFGYLNVQKSFAAAQRVHVAIIHRIDLQTCVLSMTTEERSRMRESLKAVGGR